MICEYKVLRPFFVHLEHQTSKNLTEARLVCFGTIPLWLVNIKARACNIEVIGILLDLIQDFLKQDLISAKQNGICKAGFNVYLRQIYIKVDFLVGGFVLNIS
ncbi:hypothetical protein PCANB_000740 [Pneumocystis canis]|nr:hypothetical protein PCANB_000740 [Pneumocystis canis]